MYQNKDIEKIIRMLDEKTSEGTGAIYVDIYKSTNGIYNHCYTGGDVDSMLVY